MSRNIMQLHEPNKDNPFKKATEAKLILTKYKEKEVALFLKNNRLLELRVLDNSSQIGAIYIGKVKNIVKNLNACFVEIAEGVLCFLPFDAARQPILLNRSYDGRILQGDELLVQVQRDAMKTKQAALTCEISLSNEFFVFALGNPKIGISNKLSKEQKESLKSFFLKNNYMNENGLLNQKSKSISYGCVIRTEGGKQFSEDEEKFQKEFCALEGEFVALLENAKYKTCFSCLKPPKTPYEAILHEMCTGERYEVITDLPEAYTALQGTMSNIRLYDDQELSLLKLYSLESKIQEALGKTIWLKSGAYLVIEQTECLNTIDVNSGKMIRGTENEEAIWKINEEAAKEAALQISLRNLSGIIIIDFINMKDKAQEEKLLLLMKELVAKHNTLTKVVDITPLGLMELTRKKIGPSLKEQLQCVN